MVDVVSSVYYGHHDKLKMVTQYTHRLFTVTKLKKYCTQEAPQHH